MIVIALTKVSISIWSPFTNYEMTDISKEMEELTSRFEALKGKFERLKGICERITSAESSKSRSREEGLEKALDLKWWPAGADLP